MALKREWRVNSCAGKLAIAILDVFSKDTRTTPDDAIRNSKRRSTEFRKVDGS